MAVVHGVDRGLAAGTLLVTTALSVVAGGLAKDSTELDPAETSIAKPLVVGSVVVGLLNGTIGATSAQVLGASIGPSGTLATRVGGAAGALVGAGLLAGAAKLGWELME